MRGQRRGYPWLWVGLLVLLGLAVLVARAAPRERPTPAVATPTLARPTATPLAVATRAPLVAVPPPPTSPPKATATAHILATSTAVPTEPPTAVVAHGAKVALTFDAGADRGYTTDILDLLQEQHIKASFGVTGQWAKANPELVRRMAADGHMVFNHSLDHRSFTGISDHLGGLSPSQRRAELEEADAILAPLIGHSSQPWYRLPYGDDDAHVIGDVAPAGYSRKIGWTVDSLGWRGASAPDIVARCLKLAAPNAIYVLHVGRGSQDGLALPTVVAGLRERAYSFGRIDEL